VAKIGYLARVQVLAVRLVEDEVLAIYRQRIFAVGSFVRRPQTRQEAQRIRPTEIVWNRMMKNGVECSPVVGRHMTPSLGHLAFFGH
jgi:hypothetical protein